MNVNPPPKASMRGARRRACALAATLAVAIAAPLRAAPGSPGPVPATVKLKIAAGRELVLSHPAYLSTSVEDTPYQLMQTCDAHGHACRTLLELRAGSGVSLATAAGLGLSPDRRYALCFRLAGVDVRRKAYRGQEYEVYDLQAGEPVEFATADGTSATTGNILGWSAGQPHALEVSAGVRKTALALPPT
jgi:hypothetical protein